MCQLPVAIPPVGLMPVELLPIESVTDQDMFFEQGNRLVNIFESRWRQKLEIIRREQEGGKNWREKKRLWYVI